MAEQSSAVLQVPIDTVGIDVAFAKLLLESKLGAAITKAVEETLAQRHYGSAIDSAIKSCVASFTQGMITELLETKREHLKQVIASRITDQFLEEMSMKLVSAVFEQARY